MLWSIECWLNPSSVTLSISSLIMLYYMTLVLEYLLSIWVQSLETQFTVSVDTSNVLHTVDDKFLSVSLSPRHLGNSSVHRLFDTKRFSSLLTGLSPCFLRAGGTAGEFVTFNSSYNEVFPTPPPVSEDGVEENETLSKFQPITMYGNQWDFINHVAKRNGAFFLYQINDMKRSGSKWQPTNFKELLNYTVEKHYASNLGFEFGNEPNAYKKQFNQSITAQKHAQEFIEAANILKSPPYSQAFKNNILVTPDISGADKLRNLKYLESFLRTSQDTVDKVTFHQYYLNAKRQHLEVANFTDPDILDSLIGMIQQVRAVVNEVGHEDKKIWLGETGSASGGGAPGLSNRYVAGFMWLDKLGISARYGIDVVIRQTLYSYDNHYALIYHDLEPYPDYWLSHVFKKLVGRKVYKVTVTMDAGKLRCYASNMAESEYLTKEESDSITVYCLNLYPHEVEITLQLPFKPSLINGYTLEAYGEEGLTSRYVQLNGERLMMTSEDTLPDLNPVSLDPDQPIIMPATSMSFYTIHEKL